MFIHHSTKSPNTLLEAIVTDRIFVFSLQKGNGSSGNNDGDREGNWPHLKLAFLQPDKIMDKQKRKANHTDYDPKTLYVPLDFKNQCSPVSTIPAKNLILQLGLNSVRKRIPYTFKVVRANFKIVKSRLI